MFTDVVASDKEFSLFNKLIGLIMQLMTNFRIRKHRDVSQFVAGGLPLGGNVGCVALC